MKFLGACPGNESCVPYEGFRVLGLGFRALGLGFGIQGLGFKCLRLRALGEPKPCRQRSCQAPFMVCEMHPAGSG